MANPVPLLLFWVWSISFYVSRDKTRFKHTWCFGLLKELCVLLTFNLALKADSCGPTHLPQQLQKMFTYTLLYPVIQQFCRNALIHWPLGVACNSSHNSKSKFIQYGKAPRCKRAEQPSCSSSECTWSVKWERRIHCDGKHIIHDKAKNYFQQHQPNGNVESAFN